MKLATPFHRSLTMAEAIASFIANLSPTEARRAIMGLAPYRSRGKGGAKGFQPSSGMTRAARLCNNAYETVGHQGAREMARRVRQQEKRDAKNQD